MINLGNSDQNRMYEATGGTYLRVDSDGRLMFADDLKSAFLKTFHGRRELFFPEHETQMEEEMWEEFKKTVEAQIAESK